MTIEIILDYPERSEEVANKSSWKNSPMVNPKSVEIDLQFSEKDFSKITRGYLPQAMEDKWFIYYEDGWLYFHRSWTGVGIFKAQVLYVENLYSIKEFFVESNMYGKDVTLAKESFTKLVNLLLD